MRIRVALILDTLHGLALALWLGGLVTLLGVAIPAFAAEPSWLPSASEALIGLLLPQYGNLVTLCGLIVIGAHFILRRRYQTSRLHFIADGVRQLLAFGAFFLAEFAHYNLIPVMNRFSMAPLMEDQEHKFQTAHDLFVRLGVAQAVLLVAVMAISAWLTLPPPRTATAPIVEETPPAPSVQKSVSSSPKRPKR